MVLEEGDEVCLLGRGGELDGVLDEDGSGLSAAGDFPEWRMDDAEKGRRMRWREMTPT